MTREDRDAYRRERGWERRRVLTYLGKLSDLYMPREMAHLFLALRRIDPRFFFQVLTPSDAAPIRTLLEDAGVSGECDVRFVRSEEIPKILVACDATVSFRKGETSKRAASPTKLGESLAAGLPIVSNAGLGDCDSILEGHGLGVVMRGFDDADHRSAAARLVELMNDTSLARRCREFAARELSLQAVGGPRYQAVYERLLAD